MSEINSPSAITVSLEWAKKLKEAGWERDNAEFIWSDTHKKLHSYGAVEGHFAANDLEVVKNLYAAPTAEEILRRLPSVIRDGDTSMYFTIGWNEDVWCVAYEKSSGVSRNIFKTDASLANAAAAMWCYLKENNLLPQS